MAEQDVGRTEAVASAEAAGSPAEAAPPAGLSVVNRRGIARSVARRTAAPGRPPIVLDVGKKRRKAIKALKRGRGSVMADVEQIVEDVRAELGAGAAPQGKEIVPLVLIYRQTRRRRARRF